MLVGNRVSSIRKKKSQNKLYIPAKNRENQYLLVEFELTNDVIATLMSGSQLNREALANFYLEFKQNFFQCCKLNNIKNSVFFAKDKLVRVRFGEESQLIETAEQMIVFYDPKRHSGFRAFYDNEQLAAKLVLAVFATGEDIRFDAAQLHSQTATMIRDLAQALGFCQSDFKIRDHQHITYELLAAEKGDKKTTTHGLRCVPQRYQQQNLIIPDNSINQGYVVATMPIPMALIEQAEAQLAQGQPYQALYKSLVRMLLDVASEQDVVKVAIIINGKQPIVRTNQSDPLQVTDELVYLSFSQDEEPEYMADWNSVTLVDTLDLVFQPTKEDIYAGAFGRYMNKINSALRQMVKIIGVDANREDVMVRFHQNTQYQFPREQKQ